MFNFFSTELKHILSDFHGIIAQLERFEIRVENLAYKKLDKAEQLKQEATDHLDEVAQAKAISANISALVTPVSN